MAAAVSLTFLTAGCGTSSSGPQRLAVNGTATVDSEPASGTLSFQPVGKGPAAGTAVVGGVFEIPSERGPVAGVYRVMLTTTVDKLAVTESDTPPPEPRSIEVTIKSSGQPLDLEF